ncbi:MAG TPA: hypothetical protein ACQGQH_09290 [Xylella sp.]
MPKHLNKNPIKSTYNWHAPSPYLRHEQTHHRRQGFAFVKGYLITPERKKLEPYQMAWLPLTCTLAQEWQRMMKQARADTPDGGGVATDNSLATVITLHEVLMKRHQQRSD